MIKFSLFFLVFTQGIWAQCWKLKAGVFLIYISSSPLQLPILDVLRKIFHLSKAFLIASNSEWRSEMSDLYTCECIQSLCAAGCYLALLFFLDFDIVHLTFTVWSDSPTHFEEVGPSRSAAGSVLRSPAHNCEFTGFKMREESTRALTVIGIHKSI